MNIITKQKIDAVFTNRLSTGVSCKDGDRNKFIDIFEKIANIQKEGLL